MRARATRLVLATAAMVTVLAGCGGSTPAPEPDPEPPAATDPAPEPEPPAGFPLDVASGRLGDGSAWTLTVTGLGEVCLRADDVSDCTEHEPWAVGVAERRLVYVAVPSCVARLELHAGGAVVATSTTTVDDDVAYGLVESAAAVDEAALVGVGANGIRLFKLDRLDDAPSARVPAIGC